jgi:hypothetical protein
MGGGGLPTHGKNQVCGAYKKINMPFRGNVMSYEQYDML